MDTEYCGCCGGNAALPPKGEHGNCCASMHDTPAVTAGDIAELRDEAGQHGDSEQVAICTAALEGDAAAIAECARVIAAAREA